MSLVLVGASSRISHYLREMTDESVMEARLEVCPIDEDKYFVAAGHLYGRKISELTPEQIAHCSFVNLIGPMLLCETILESNATARICLMGSESAIAGSYDRTYAANKAGLHAYVETRKLKPDQQLVCIAPGIIADAGMTTRRTDTQNLAARSATHPKRRFVTAREVASLAYFLLFVDRGYISNTVIRMNGGEHIK